MVMAGRVERQALPPRTILKNSGGRRMTTNLSRRSLLALGAGLGASTMLGGSALARAPKLGTQTPYWHRFVVGDAEVTVVSDGPLPLGDPSGTFTGVPKEEVKKMLVGQLHESRQCRARAELAGRQHRRQARAVRHRHGHVKSIRADHGPAAEEPRSRRHQGRATSTRSSARMPISTTSAASSAPTTSRSSPTRRSISPRATTITGPTRASSAVR